MSIFFISVTWNAGAVPRRQICEGVCGGEPLTTQPHPRCNPQNSPKYGAPQNRWFRRDNSMKMDALICFGGTPIYGNLHHLTYDSVVVELCFCWRDEATNQQSVLALPIFQSHRSSWLRMSNADHTLGSRQGATNQDLWNDDPKKDPGQSTVPLHCQAVKLHRQLDSSGVWDCLHSSNKPRLGLDTPATKWQHDVQLNMYIYICIYIYAYIYICIKSIYIYYTYVDMCMQVRASWIGYTFYRYDIKIVCIYIIIIECVYIYNRVYIYTYVAYIVYMYIDYLDVLDSLCVYIIYIIYIYI